MGLISRVSSRTYRFISPTKKSLKTPKNVLSTQKEEDLQEVQLPWSRARKTPRNVHGRTPQPLHLPSPTRFQPRHPPTTPDRHQPNEESQGQLQGNGKTCSSQNPLQELDCFARYGRQHCWCLQRQAVFGY